MGLFWVCCQCQAWGSYDDSVAVTNMISTEFMLTLFQWCGTLWAGSGVESPITIQPSMGFKHDFLGALRSFAVAAGCGR
jgi:hypothetical protein